MPTALSDRSVRGNVAARSQSGNYIGKKNELELLVNYADFDGSNYYGETTRELTLQLILLLRGVT